ncbi:MAG: DUF3467 domain-containing protein [Methanoregula sp.]|jgi:hypothetical protein|nr:hypothetical protein [Methanoregula sp.]
MPESDGLKISFNEDPFNLFYADVFRMSYSITTMNIEYSQLLPREGDELPRCRYIGTVLMSPQGAKILSGLLQSQVADYEKAHGEIRI